MKLAYRFLIALALAYLFGAFAHWDLHPAGWSKFDRLILVLAAVAWVVEGSRKVGVE